MRLNPFLNKQCHDPLLPGGGLFINNLVVDRSYETVHRGRNVDENYVASRWMFMGSKTDEAFHDLYLALFDGRQGDIDVTSLN